MINALSVTVFLIILVFILTIAFIQNKIHWRKVNKLPINNSNVASESVVTNNSLTTNNSTITPQDRRLFKNIKVTTISVVALIGIVIIGFFVWWAVITNGPSNYYVEHFETAKVKSQALATKQYLQTILTNLPMSASGFKYFTTEYLDGCSADNGDSYSSWQKVCTAELVNVYGSKVGAGTTEQQLLPIMQQANWGPTTPYSFINNCYGYANSNVVPGNPEELIDLSSSYSSYTPSYEVSSTISGCTLNNSLLRADGTPTDNSGIWVEAQYKVIKPIDFSSLTQKTPLQTIVNRLKTAGYSSFIIITLSKQYFDQTLGL